MKTTFTNLNNTRLAYNEVPQKANSSFETNSTEEYFLLKNMQSKVDRCLAQPSQTSIDAILATLAKI